jgi:hypothetical protein
LTDAKTGAQILPSSMKGHPLTSLNADGTPNPGALNVEWDISVTPYHAPSGGSLVRIWGLGLADLSQAYGLGASGPTGPNQAQNGAKIAIFGGMSAGLPLANPSQSGLLVRGQVLQGLGNWLGTDMTTDLFIAPPAGTVDDPMNFVLNWRAQSPLASALQATLSTVYPNVKLKITLSDRLVRSHDEIGAYATLTQLATVIKGISHSIIQDPNYGGVTINWDGDQTLVVTDLTGPPAPAKMLLFRDMIGQPTWLRPLTVGVKCVMRADIGLQDVVSLPPKGPITNTAAAFLRFQDQSAFTGNFVVQSIHHYGNFRQPDAASWNTTLEMVPEFKNV